MIKSNCTESKFKIFWIVVITVSIIVVSFLGGYYFSKSSIPKIIIDPHKCLSVYEESPRSQESPMSPMIIQQVLDSPRIVLIHDFLSENECNSLIQKAEPRFMPSTVQLDENKVSPKRTSMSTHFLKNEDSIIQSIENRAAILSGLPQVNIEPLQIVKYLPGQCYKEHYDFFPPDAVGSTQAMKKTGQRLVTLFVYLNNLPEDDQGGSTNFSKLGIQFKPRKGTAVMFWNVKPDGKEDYLLLHAGEPPQKSIKYGLNIWIRQRPWKT